MKLTCVTATFNCIKAGNRERLIRCVESVAKLKTEHEHLIYDGASTDGTVELLRELEAKTPGMKVVSESDTGVYNAMNKGVRDAKGEWFYVLGCDDFISHPEVLDRDLEDEFSGKYSVIVTPVERDNGKKEFYWGYQDMMTFLRRNPCSHQGLVMRTSAVRALGGFDEQYRLAGDYDLQVKTHFGALPYLYLEEPFALFASGGLSAVNMEKTNGEIDTIIQKKLKISARDLKRYRQLGFMPLSVMALMMRQKDPLLGQIGKRMWKAWAKNILRVALWPLVLIRRRLRSK